VELLGRFFALMSTALSHVPDTVWAALIAAGVAFVTTTLSNRNSRKQLAMQLDHNARQQKLEREMSLRRDVYLPAIEAASRIQASMSRLVDVKEDQTALGRSMVDNTASLLKAHLVAQQPTVTALMKFQRAVMPGYVQMLVKRAPLVARKTQIDLTQGFMDSSIAEHQRIVQLMKEHNIAGSTDRAAMERLNLQAKNELENHSRHFATMNELNAQQGADLLALGATLTDWLEEHSSLLPEALLCARRDLELPIDEAEYRRLSTEQQSAAVAIMRDMPNFYKQAHGKSGPPEPPRRPD
jgi:hypothetical protein